jgi:hypothetical protein
VIYVISTGWKHATKHVCLASVRNQTADREHIYIEASEQNPPRTKMENLNEQIQTLPPDAIVALVDGDDWLAHNRVLKTVQLAHQGGAWITYGSFITSEGQKGFAARYDDDQVYRKERWKATHLKTFRAGLWQKIKPQDLHYQGKWIDRGDDPAFMIPMLEMAGPARVQFIEEILYVYDWANAWEQSCPPAEKAHELAIVEHVRSLPIYKPLERLS